MGNGQPDKRGLKILIGHYWPSQGWVPENERTVAPEDFEYAKPKRWMFDPIEVGYKRLGTVFKSNKRVNGTPLSPFSAIVACSLHQPTPVSPTRSCRRGSARLRTIILWACLIRPVGGAGSMESIASG
jgi:hypothetical protein